jgi:TPR repeat protein
MVLADLHQRGRSVTRDHDRALELYETAAAGGHVEAYRFIGDVYLFGIGRDQTFTKAVEWYGKAEENDDAMASLVLAWMKVDGIGVPVDEVAAVAHLRNGEQLKDGRCTADLGWFYECGWGVDVDLAAASKWYALGVERGYEDAAADLARLKTVQDASGANTESQVRDTVEGLYAGADSRARRNAFAALGALGARGSGEAAYHVGAAYHYELGTPRDGRRAFRWYLRAARRGVPAAKFALGELYRESQLTLRAPVKSDDWYARAAADGDEGVRRTVAWRQRLADAGHPGALRALQRHVVDQAEKMSREDFQKLVSRASLPEKEDIRQTASDDAAGAEWYVSKSGRLFRVYSGLASIDNFDHAKHQIGYPDFKVNAVAMRSDAVWLATNHGLYKMHRHSETPSSWQRFAVRRNWQAVDIAVTGVAINGDVLTVTYGPAAKSKTARYDLRGRRWLDAED